jgi:hypothetical protein
MPVFLMKLNHCALRIRRSEKECQCKAPLDFDHLIVKIEAGLKLGVTWWRCGESNPGPPACKAGALAS